MLKTRYAKFLEVIHCKLSEDIVESFRVKSSCRKQIIRMLLG